MAKVIFLQSRKGTSKKGNAYQMVSLAQVMDEDCERVHINDFFVDAGKDFSQYRFGDEVQAMFEESDFIGGRPRLSGLKPVHRSPYRKP